MDHEKQPELRLAGDSFSEALSDDGHAGELGVAQTLAEKHHLPLVDLAVSDGAISAADATTSCCCRSFPMRRRQRHRPLSAPSRQNERRGQASQHVDADAGVNPFGGGCCWQLGAAQPV